MADQEAPPITRTREFWELVGYAAVLGLLTGFMAYVFIAIVDWTTEALWPETTEYGLFSGEPWWILLMAGAGLLIGLLRRLLGVHEVIPGLFDEVDERRIEPRFVSRRVLVSFVSLIGGASVGPEAALGSMGGGLGTFISERRHLSVHKTETNTLVGMAGAFGGLFAAPMISALLVVEAATEGGRARYIATTVPTLVASTAGFAIYFALAGTSFIDVYQVPPFDLELWHFLVAVPLGVVAAGIAGLLGVSMGMVHRATAKLRARPELLGVLGGLALGAIAVAFPLTRFSGAGELATLLNEAPELAAGLLVAIVLAKIVAVALSFGTGFYGGPIFPMIFIGGASGVAIHALFPGIPEGLAVVIMFAAVPGAGASIPFTLTFLAALTLTLDSPIDSAPAALGAAISYGLFTGFLDRKPRNEATPDPQPDAP
jgi:H+/Cl- antiporter ClcA